MHSSRSYSLPSLLPLVGILCLSVLMTSCLETVEPAPSSSKSGSSALLQGEPRFAYAVNNASETLSVFAVTNGGADLQHLSFAETGPDPVHVSVSPDGTLVVVCNFGASDVTVYRVDPVSGMLDEGEALECGGSPVASVFHASGQFLYVANSRSDSVSKFAVDNVSGTITRISGDSNAGINPQALLLSKDGSHLYMINSLAESLWTYDVDDASGELRPVRSVRVGFVPLGMALDPSGNHLYVVGGLERGRLLAFDLDPQTGKATPMSDGRQELGRATLPVSAQVSAAGDSLYVALKESGEVLTIALAPTTGVPGEEERLLLSEGSEPEALLLQAGGKRLLLVDSGPDEVLTLELSSPKTLTPSLTTPAMRTQDYPLSVAYGYGKSPSTFRTDHVLVSNSDDGTMSFYAMDSKVNGGTGATTELSGSPVVTGNLPAAIALHPRGGWVYAAGRVGISVFAFTTDRIEPRKGILLGDHVDLIPGRRGKFVYAIEGGSLSRLQPYAIDPRRGTLDAGDLQFVPTGQFSSRGAMDPTGRFLYVPNSREDTISNFVVDVRSGQPIERLKTQTGRGPSAVAVHPSGKWAYVTLADSGEITQFPIDPVTGRLGTGSSYTQQVSKPGNRPVDLAIDPNGRFLYVADPVRQEITLFLIDEQSGFLIQVASHQVSKPVQRVRVDASGYYLLAAYDNGTRGGLVSFEIDAKTGGLGSSSTSLTGRQPRSITVDLRRD